MKTLAITVHMDRRQQGLQVSLVDETGSGYRIAGPKFAGASEQLQHRELNERDADEIRDMLDRVFPRKK